MSKKKLKKKAAIEEAAAKAFAKTTLKAAPKPAAVKKASKPVAVKAVAAKTKTAVAEKSEPVLKKVTADAGLQNVEAALHLLGGRWKLPLLFQLLRGGVMRFSDLERAIPAVTQKMLGQQLRQMEEEGLVIRTVYPQVPPKVEYSLTAWGKNLGPALEAMALWAGQR